MIDVTHQINAVRRQVGKRMFKAGEARVVTVSQTYDSDVEDVWDACTNAERIPRWFLPVSGDLTPGGRYQLEGNASGTIERCDPPKGFAATWEYDGHVSWIELRLTPDAEGGTRFELAHLAHVDDDPKWAEFGPGAVGVGWDLAVMGLAMHLSSGRRVNDPQEVGAWLGSEEGKRFMTLSSQGWCDANVAAGEDVTVARTAADATTAAYTGASPES
ncbi:SRPBCC family protein [Streptomyces sporangiiformans]|uniref:SRPBCC family protein n=1 Tax=Streptomyces sporangiiformans TaxID=2315329 RepID=A0A505CYD0_9ACTN|nr:SRPBCC family protein [Streptomyces sporangiiformans]TPQ17043.1 SRPBCC family protein [Streptomyces sporangiiformans]